MSEIVIYFILVTLALAVLGCIALLVFQASHTERTEAKIESEGTARLAAEVALAGVKDRLATAEQQLRDAADREKRAAAASEATDRAFAQAQLELQQLRSKTPGAALAEFNRIGGGK